MKIGKGPIIFALILFFAVMFYLSYAGSERRREEHRKYVICCRFYDIMVKEGDTLWSITEDAMKKGWMPGGNVEKNLYDIVLKNPTLEKEKNIIPGQIIHIPLTKEVK